MQRSNTAAARGGQRTRLYPARRHQLNRISVAEEHFCTAATQWIMAGLYRRAFHRTQGKRRLVGACVSGEPHEIGTRMVCDVLQLEGWDTYYFGANTPNADVVRFVLDSG